jgi:hypothetical protein
MKHIRLFCASIVTLLAACLLHAADSKPITRVLAVSDIETDDPSGYATWVAKYNEVAKARLNIDNYIRVFQSTFDGKGTGRVRISVSAGSVAEMFKNTATLESDPAILDFLTHVRAIRKQGPRVLYAAVRFEGLAPKGAWNYSTLAVVNDEAGYLHAIDQLRSLFDANNFKDVKIAVYRALAGRTDHTHRIVISATSSAQLGALLDFVASNAAMAQWLADSAKFRTVVSNTTAHEITK